MEENWTEDVSLFRKATTLFQMWHNQNDLTKCYLSSVTDGKIKTSQIFLIFRQQVVTSVFT